ncbi:beta strand repeat-containing protein [Trichormus variabilis]|uniref:beta strand repeat-containing protein n=1 Tax=Anabaena variabilis TaxID=264691 RepID=UPI001A7E66FB|nr:SBBP repeat-containing protein [Trichormus variabilis]
MNLSSYQDLDGTTLETKGATVWTGNGAFYAYNGAIWNNTSTGTIDLQGDADFYQNGGTLPTFNNAGTLIKSNGSTTGSDNSYVSSIFNNTGTVDIKKGTLIFVQGYTQTTGTTRLSGGSITFDYIPLNLQGGTLVGIGTITGNVNNTGGQVNPGNTIGTLNITGDYSQSGTGTLNLELGSAASFDKFNITGAADVGGILKLNLTAGYTPTIGTKFTVLTYGSATTKSFNTIQGIDISSSLAFAPTSTGKNLILEVVDQVKDLGAIIFSSPQSVTDFVGDTDLSDFYRFNVTTASNIQVKLTNLTANADVWLVDGLGRTIAKGIKAGTADELVSWAVDAGTYYIKVLRPAAGNNANYTLQVAASTNPWPVQNGGVYDDYVNAVSNDSTGNVYAAGYGYDFDHGNIDAGIVKYNPDGTQTWFQQFTSTGNDYAFGVGNDSAGNVYATGYTDGSFAGSTLQGTSDAFITKYNTNGTQAWVKQFGTAADDYAYSTSVDGSGNSYIAGKTWGTFTGNSTQGAYDAFIAKYDTNGTQTWIKQFGTSSDDEATSVILDGSTNTILVTGDTSGSFAGSTNLGGTDIFVSKYDTNGTQTWVKQLGTNNYDYSTGVASDSTGNIYVTGYTSYGAFAGNTNKGAEDGFLAKYSSTGTLAWVKQFGTTGQDFSQEVKTDSAGNIYVVGNTSGTFTGNTSVGGWDSYIAKYNTSGTQLWVKQFGTTSTDEAVGLSLDNQGNIYVSGRTNGSFPTYTNQGGTDGYIALFDTNGNQLSVPITSTVVPPNITLAVSPASVTEDGTPNLVYTFTRTGSTTNALTVNYGIAGTADSSDYTGATPGTGKTITFAAGSSTATLTIDPTADTTVETDETVALTLATGTGYTIGTTTAVTGTITNDDVALPNITLAVSPASVTEDGTTNLVYTFTRTGSTTNALTVNYGIAGTAASTDYTGATPGTGKTITFAAGSSTATLTIDPTADTTVETDETVALTLATGTGYTIGTTTAVTGTITNDDVALPNITLAVSPASVTEDGTTNLVYTFTRTGSTTNALTVNYGIAGTAASTDYTGATPGTGKTITFAAGSSTATLTINPTADTTVESNETVGLTLATGTGYTVGTTTAVTGTITNDDVAPSVTINLSADQTIVEGKTSPQNVSYTVTLSTTSTQIITVQYASTNGTSIAGSDYTNTTETLTFNPGIKTQVINIPILNDGINEADETFTLTLTSPTNASLGTKTSAITTITDTLVASVSTTLPTNVENLTLTGATAINGTGNAGDNVFKGNSANNTLTGLNGNDTYSFVANTVLGTDKIVETTTGGIDTIDFSGTTASVNVNLGVITSQTVNSNLKLILSANNVIENATGGTGNDRLTGNALDNLIIGGEGNDQLQGLAGNDILWGGLGDDLLNGGLGNDQYRFQGNGVFSTSLGVDYITQFDAGQDKIVLSKSTFTAITNTVGQALTNFAVVTDDALVNGNAARIVYSQSSGSLFYNQDGNVLGAGTVFEFARLGNLDITLASSDFSLIA